MQAKSHVRAVISCALIPAIAAFPTNEAVAQPTPGVRQLVSAGPPEFPVNQPAINRLVYEQFPASVPDVFMVAWQREFEDTQGASHRPHHVNYAFTTFNNGTLQAWNAPFMPVPLPGSGYDRMTQPALVLREDTSEVNYTIVFAGHVFDSSDPFDTAVITNDTNPGTTTFGTSVFVPGGPAVHPRLGVFQPFGGFPDIIHMFASNPGPGGNPEQLIISTSVDSGATFSTWQPITVNGNAIFGYPSEPVYWKPGFPTPVFSYALAPPQPGVIYIHGAYEDETTGAFLTTGLNPTINIDIPQGQSYYTRSNQSIAGHFGTGLYPSMTAPWQPTGVVYVAYQDFAAPAVGFDGNFDVFLVRGQTTGTVWTWGTPFRVNAPDSDEKADQFMPVVVADPAVAGRLHVAWYDTRDDLQDPDDDVKIGIHYARITDNNGTLSVDGELALDLEAIDTSYLLNPLYIGDRIDMAVTPKGEQAIVVYMGTEHPRAGSTTAPQDDEAIFSYTVIQN